jgi:hypothetical protein
MPLGHRGKIDRTTRSGKDFVTLEEGDLKLRFVGAEFLCKSESTSDAGNPHANNEDFTTSR